jgi:pyruvate dehydrogenase E1 component
VAELGEVCWIVDLNRQSLDRIVPNIGAVRLAGMFDAAGWQVLTVKYGRLLHELFTRPGGDALRRRIDEMSNPEYQRLLRCAPAQLRERLPGEDAKLGELVAGLDDATLHAAIRNLGGHDMHALREAFTSVDDTRPTVIFAYTVKGYGLATEGHPQNHSSLLTADQMGQLAQQVGASTEDSWARFPTSSAAAALCRETAERLRREPVAPHAVPRCPPTSAAPPAGTPPPRPRSAAPCSTSPAPPRTPRSASSRWPRTCRRRRTSAAG